MVRVACKCVCSYGNRGGEESEGREDRPGREVEELPQGKQALWAGRWLKVPGGHGWQSSS